jgi:predicted HTH domain antitoxin
MNTPLAREIASEVPIFKAIEQKEDFLFVLGALLARVISLQKAAEVMGMEVDGFLKILDLLGLEFSYLTDEDVVIEKSW